jgi:hypothetical protein
MINICIAGQLSYKLKIGGIDIEKEELYFIVP